MTSDGDDQDAGVIGVGMGGSCPECRAPVELGQQFCLECGAPIRFNKLTGPRKSTPSEGSRPRANVQTIELPSQKGFPWVPFLIVIILVLGAIVFAVTSSDPPADGDKASDSVGESSSLPEITNVTTDTPATTSGTQTTTIQDCDPTLPLDDTVPLVDEISPDGGIDTIPQLGADGTFDDGSIEDPAAQPLDQPAATEDTVQVDQNGNLCSFGNEPAPPADDPDTTTTAGDAGVEAGKWPEGTEGWTVILASYKAAKNYTEQDAVQRSTTAQEKGLDAGVLVSDQFSSLNSGFYVVFNGVYDTQEQARAELTASKNAGFPQAYVSEIVPR